MFTYWLVNSKSHILKKKSIVFINTSLQMQKHCIQLISIISKFNFFLTDEDTVRALYNNELWSLYLAWNLTIAIHIVVLFPIINFFVRYFNKIKMKKKKYKTLKMSCQNRNHAPLLTSKPIVLSTGLCLCFWMYNIHVALVFLFSNAVSDVKPIMLDWYMFFNLVCNCI